MKSSTRAAAHLATLEHLDPHWMWHHCALLRLRQSVLHAQGGRAAPLAPGLAACPPDHQHASNHEAVLAEQIPPAQRLAEIDAALARIRLHTYGVCEATGVPIPAARLRAMPWTRFAVPASERSARASRT